LKRNAVGVGGSAVPQQLRAGWPRENTKSAKEFLYSVRSFAATAVWWDVSQRETTHLTTDFPARGGSGGVAAMSRKEIMACFLINFLFLGCASNKEHLAPHTPQPLYLELSFGHTNHKGTLKQQIAVEPESSFNIVTNVDAVRWTLSGRLGALHEGVIPLTVSVRHYFSDRQNSTLTTTQRLHLDQEGQGGGVSGGPHISPSVWTELRE
jgi:hypothetical protein